MSSSPERKILTLKSSDEVPFDIEESAIISQSMLIATLLEHGWLEGSIPISQYCNKHHDSGLSDNDLREWDAKFIDMGDFNPLFDLISAADFLEMKNLSDLGWQAAANMMGKSVKEIQAISGKLDGKEREPSADEKLDPSSGN